MATKKKSVKRKTISQRRLLEVAAQHGMLLHRVEILEHDKGVIIAERDGLRNTVNQIESLFPHGNKSNLVHEVITLIDFRRYHEGMKHPMHEQIQDLKEIVRWLVQPSTAHYRKLHPEEFPGDIDTFVKR